MSPADGRTPDESYLRRIERDSLIACAALTLIAIPLGGFRPDAPLGILAGTALMAYSYRSIRGGVVAITARARESATGEAAAGGDRVRRVAWALAKFIARYGVLALSAWVILVPLRASPLSVFVGVSVPVFAVAAEAFRALRSARG